MNFSAHQFPSELIIALLCNALSADENKFLRHVVVAQLRSEAVAMEPILAFIALQHKAFQVVDSLLIVRLFAMTVKAEEILTVNVCLIFVFLFWQKAALERHP